MWSVSVLLVLGLLGNTPGTWARPKDKVSTLFGFVIMVNAQSFAVKDIPELGDCRHLTFSQQSTPQGVHDVELMLMQRCYVASRSV